jgi:hypothetical protein
MLKSGKAMTIPIVTKMAGFTNFFQAGLALLEASFDFFMSSPKTDKCSGGCLPNKGGYYLASKGYFKL